MTILAYRDGILAADDSIHLGSTRLFGRKKVHRRGDGVLIGATGAAATSEPWVKWALAGCEGKAPPLKSGKGGADTVMIYPDGTVEFFDVWGMHTSKPQYYAIGAGIDFALGALFVGAGAVQAVKAAIRHSDSCGGEVQWVSHRELDPAQRAYMKRELRAA